MASGADPSGQTIAVLKLAGASGTTDGSYQIKLMRENTILGREKGDILVDDGRVSSSHCQVQHIPGKGYFIFDMNSSNGTFVNGERVVRHQLSPGDRIAIGNSTFVFELVGANEGQEAAFPAMERQKNRTKIVDAMLPTTGQWTLTIVARYHDGREESYSFQEREVVVGRGASFGSFDQDRKISRRHLILRVNSSGEIFAEDLGSTNGSKLNGQPLVGAHRVGPGDQIQLGACTLQARTNKPEP